MVSKTYSFQNKPILSETTFPLPIPLQKYLAAHRRGKKGASDWLQKGPLELKAARFCSYPQLRRSVFLPGLLCGSEAGWEDRQSAFPRLACEAASVPSVAQEEKCGEGIQSRRSARLHRTAGRALPLFTPPPAPLANRTPLAFELPSLVFKSALTQALHTPTSHSSSLSGRPGSRLWGYYKKLFLGDKAQGGTKWGSRNFNGCKFKSAPPPF